MILLYLTIEIASWHAGDDPSSRKRFTDWVSKYVLSGSSLKCTAIDLYAARCGLVHAYSPVSDLAVAGKARPLGYAYKPRRVEDLEELVSKSAKLNYQTTGQADDPLAFIPVQFEQLFDSVRSGITMFFESLKRIRHEPRKPTPKLLTSLWDLSTEKGADLLRLGRAILGENVNAIARVGPPYAAACLDLLSMQAR